MCSTTGAGASTLFLCLSVTVFCCVCCWCGACCMMSCVRFCGVLQLQVTMAPSSVVLSGRELSSRLFTFTRGRGLTLTSARVLVRPHVDGPGSQPTDALDHTSCVSRALMPTLAVEPHARVSSSKRRGSLHRLAHSPRCSVTCGN